MTVLYPSIPQNNQQFEHQTFKSQPKTEVTSAKKWTFSFYYISLLFWFITIHMEVMKG